MSRKRYFCFKFEGDDSPHWLTPNEAYEKSKAKSLKITHNGYLRAIKSVKRTKDGFQSGYQPGLGEYCGGPKEYAQKCKEKGLVEMGKDYKAPTVSRENNLFSDDMGKEMSEMGMSDREISFVKDA